MKSKIAERKSGYRCRDCGKVFRTEEAAFAHQARACSPTTKRRTAPRPGKTKELTWYRITDGIADHTTDKWSEVIDAVTGWYDHVFPTYVGMNRTNGSQSTCEYCVPHGYGDEPHNHLHMQKRHAPHPGDIFMPL